MKTYLAFVVFSFSSVAFADGSARLVLRAYVPPAINTTISQTQLSSSKSLVTFTSQMNSRYLSNEQKFEVEGLDQSGLEANLKRIAGNDRSIQYELLVKHLKDTMPVHKPIFLKISAN
ncbi:hypothetical protein DOM21_02805 [Bacteriovorax stolpii]|uniref:Uncharacterized protein n=1 Tax=Bacteriovorax stolpii TaxID=960 RepID=A0A2K9NX09_BACTC|nr:hypothetical protein [Bacteriovorax stolpii]AUN99605.1 hypothetical protein C0V70_16120 [Bacteriovorax stolpii]QDK40400.1 hypothetical protein DOM21_02805 [Bacteriovorax stolpii]TDP51235.1 hypothetical protein C8D79_3406 [Bacteriovorax stolpii]